MYRAWISSCYHLCIYTYAHSHAYKHIQVHAHTHKHIITHAIILTHLQTYSHKFSPFSLKYPWPHHHHTQSVIRNNISSAIFQLKILLPQTPKGWDGKTVPPKPTYIQIKEHSVGRAWDGCSLSRIVGSLHMSSIVSSFWYWVLFLPLWCLFLFGNTVYLLSVRVCHLPFIFCAQNNSQAEPIYAVLLGFFPSTIIPGTQWALSMSGSSLPSIQRNCLLLFV